MWSKFRRSISTSPHEGQLDLGSESPPTATLHRLADGRLEQGEGCLGLMRLDRLFDAVLTDPVVEGDRAAHGSPS